MIIITGMKGATGEQQKKRNSFTLQRAVQDIHDYRVISARYTENSDLQQSRRWFAFFDSREKSSGIPFDLSRARFKLKISWSFPNRLFYDPQLVSFSIISLLQSTLLFPTHNHFKFLIKVKWNRRRNVYCIGSRGVVGVDRGPESLFCLEGLVQRVTS